MSRHNKFIVVSVFVLLLLGLGILPFMGDETIELPTYSLGKITRGRLKSEVSTTGRICPVITVHVGRSVSGARHNCYADSYCAD